MKTTSARAAASDSYGGAPIFGEAVADVARRLARRLGARDLAQLRVLLERGGAALAEDRAS